ncbi:hypothetical protein CSKR_203125, partial [Clonorchis sinensis]
MVAGPQSVDYKTRLAAWPTDFSPLTQKTRGGDMVRGFLGSERTPSLGELFSHFVQYIIRHLFARVLALSNILPRAEKLNSSAAPFFHLCLSGERRPLNDKNKTDPGNSCESLDPVYQSVNPLAVAHFWCIAAMQPEGSTKAGILPGCPSLDIGSREAEVGFEPRTFRAPNYCITHILSRSPEDENVERTTKRCRRWHVQFVRKLGSYALKAIALMYERHDHILNSSGLPKMDQIFHRKQRFLSYNILTSINFSLLLMSLGGMVQLLEREFTDRQVRDSNPVSASRLLSRLGQPGGIPALVLPSAGVAAGHRKGVTGEHLLLLLMSYSPGYVLCPNVISYPLVPGIGRVHSLSTTVLNDRSRKRITYLLANAKNNQSLIPVESLLMTNPWAWVVVHTEVVDEVVCCMKHIKASHTKKRRLDEQPDMPELPLADPLRDSVNLELPDLVHITGVDLDLFDMTQTSLYQARVEDITLMEESVNLIPVSNLTFGEELAFSSGMDLIQLTDNDVVVRAAATDKVVTLSTEKSRRRPLCDVDQVLEPETKVPRVQSAVLDTVTEIEEPRLLPADPSVYAIPDHGQITLDELNAFRSNGTVQALDGTVAGPSDVTLTEHPHSAEENPCISDVAEARAAQPEAQTEQRQVTEQQPI